MARSKIWYNYIDYLVWESEMYSLLKEKNVLYIEDDLVVLENISKLLQNYFKNFYTAEDAESGLSIFDSCDIDILLVDIELPKLNGIEFIREIRKVDQTIPIIIISAYTKTDYLLESVELGLEKYIVKPFTTKKVYELLRLLDSHYKAHNIIEMMDGVFLNYNQMNINIGSQKYPLTPKELEFLHILQLKRFVSYDEIDLLWSEAPPSQDAIRSFIKNIRKKLPHNVLQNRQNLGYYLEVHPDEN